MVLAQLCSELQNTLEVEPNFVPQELRISAKAGFVTPDVYVESLLRLYLPFLFLFWFLDQFLLPSS